MDRNGGGLGRIVFSSVSQHQQGLGQLPIGLQTFLQRQQAVRVCAIRAEFESCPAGDVPSFFTCIGLRAGLAVP
jgi:hypothetical protein